LPAALELRHSPSAISVTVAASDCTTGIEPVKRHGLEQRAPGQKSPTSTTSRAEHHARRGARVAPAVVDHVVVVQRPVWMSSAATPTAMAPARAAPRPRAPTAPPSSGRSALPPRRVDAAPPAGWAPPGSPCGRSGAPRPPHLGGRPARRARRTASAGRCPARVGWCGGVRHRLGHRLEGGRDKTILIFKRIESCKVIHRVSVFLFAGPAGEGEAGRAAREGGDEPGDEEEDGVSNLLSGRCRNFANVQGQLTEQHV